MKAFGWDLLGIFARSPFWFELSEVTVQSIQILDNKYMDIMFIFDQPHVAVVHVVQPVYVYVYIDTPGM